MKSLKDCYFQCKSFYMWYVSNKNPHIKDDMQTPRATSMHIMFKNKVFMGGKNQKVRNHGGTSKSQHHLDFGSTTPVHRSIVKVWELRNNIY